jgi:hypothetical protein
MIPIAIGMPIRFCSLVCLVSGPSQSTPRGEFPECQPLKSKHSIAALWTSDIGRPGRSMSSGRALGSGRCCGAGGARPDSAVTDTFTKHTVAGSTSQQAPLVRLDLEGIPALPLVRITALPTSSVSACSNAPRIVDARTFAVMPERLACEPASRKREDLTVKHGRKPREMTVLTLQPGSEFAALRPVGAIDPGQGH